LGISQVTYEIKGNDWGIYEFPAKPAMTLGTIRYQAFDPQHHNQMK